MKLPSSGIQRVFPQRVGHQILCILCLLVVIPLVTFGLLLLRTSQKAVKTTVWLNHKEIAMQATGKISEHIEGLRESLFVAASILGTLQADPWRQETTLVELSLRNPAFRRISSVDMEGHEIVTSDLGTALRNWSQDEAFQSASWGRSYLSPVKISGDHIPFLTMAEPVRQLGKVRAIVVAELNLRGVWDIVDQIRIGKKGMAYLIDQEGRIIAHPDKKLVLKNVSISHAEVIKKILAGEGGNMEETRDGQQWLMSYAPIKDLHWGLIISQPVREALAYMELMKIQYLVIFFFSVMGALLVSSVLAHYMSQPMKTLIEGTHRISQGNFSHYYPIRSRSEIDRLFFSFNRMMRKLRQVQEMEKLSMVGKAATVIAHELKNSLQLIDTFVRILPERHQDKTFIQEFSVAIPRELDSWNSLLKNMMAYAGHSKSVMRNVDINSAIIKNVALLMNLKARQMDIDLQVDLQEGLPIILGDEERLKQVFLNLLTNALEWTPPKGQIAVSTRLNMGSSSLEIEVTNTAEQDISEEVCRKMFEPFYTTKRGGLGLGLSISKQVIAEHGGSIKVISRKGATSFMIALPIVHKFVRDDGKLSRAGF